MDACDKSPLDACRPQQIRLEKASLASVWASRVTKEEGSSLGSAGTSSGSAIGDGSVHYSPGHADFESPQSEPVQVLPTLPSWRLLSASALATMEDAMAFLDAESEREGRQTTAAAQPAAFKQNALAEYFTSYSMLSSADSEKETSIFMMRREGPELPLHQN